MARLGGDEFVAAVGDGVEADRVRQQINSFLADDIAGAPRSVCCSVGVAMHSRGVDIDATLAQADVALYRDKARRSAELAVVGGSRRVD